MNFTKKYDDGSFGVADKLPCGENSHEFKRILIEKLGRYEHKLEDAVRTSLSYAVFNKFDDFSDDDNVECIIGFMLGYMGVDEYSEF